MNEDTSLISIHPLVRKFVINIVRNIQKRKYPYLVREVVHADMVPRFSEDVVMRSMGERRFIRRPAIVSRVRETRDTRRSEKDDMSVLLEPIKVRSRAPRIEKVVVPPKPVAPKPPVRNENVEIEAPKSEEVELKRDYGKIMLLLNDVSVSTIDCPGPDKQIFVVRAGQREITKISLSAVDIRELLEKLADGAHVPLMEGVFRVSVDGLSVSAVVSEMLGSKFVVKKATAYELLE